MESQNLNSKSPADSKPPPSKRHTLRSEPAAQAKKVSSPAAAHGVDVKDGSLYHAKGSVNYTTDHSTKTDFNNDYRGATKYHGAHIDHRQYTDGLHSHSDNVKSVSDHKGKTRMATGKAEKPGETQLRQCVEKFLATYCQGEEHSSMSGLADALIEAEWDRETLIQSSWNDIKDQYDGSAWKPPMFVKLRTICERWNK